MPTGKSPVWYSETADTYYRKGKNGWEQWHLGTQTWHEVPLSPTLTAALKKYHPGITPDPVDIAGSTTGQQYYPSPEAYVVNVTGGAKAKTWTMLSPDGNVDGPLYIIKSNGTVTAKSYPIYANATVDVLYDPHAEGPAAPAAVSSPDEPPSSWVLPEGYVVGSKPMAYVSSSGGYAPYLFEQQDDGTYRQILSNGESGSSVWSSEEIAALGMGDVQVSHWAPPAPAAPAPEPGVPGGEPAAVAVSSTNVLSPTLAVMQNTKIDAFDGPLQPGEKLYAVGSTGVYLQKADGQFYYVFADGTVSSTAGTIPGAKPIEFGTPGQAPAPAPKPDWVPADYTGDWPVVQLSTPTGTSTAFAQAGPDDYRLVYDDGYVSSLSDTKEVLQTGGYTFSGDTWAPAAATPTAPDAPAPAIFDNYTPTPGQTVVKITNPDGKPFYLLSDDPASEQWKLILAETGPVEFGSPPLSEYQNAGWPMETVYGDPVPGTTAVLQTPQAQAPTAAGTFGNYQTAPGDAVVHVQTEAGSDFYYIKPAGGIDISLIKR
ncbi:MAG: hypothetical protein WCG47_04855, partial [Dermatophilaceae bacterium]